MRIICGSSEPKFFRYVKGSFNRPGLRPARASVIRQNDRQRTRAAWSSSRDPVPGIPCHFIFLRWPRSAAVRLLDNPARRPEYRLGGQVCQLTGRRQHTRARVRAPVHAHVGAQRSQWSRRSRPRGSGPRRVGSEVAVLSAAVGPASRLPRAARAPPLGLSRRPGRHRPHVPQHP
jgi:hypothetical protein